MNNINSTNMIDDKVLARLFEERIASAKKELKSQEVQLKKIRELPILARNEEMIANISHTIGYLSAVVFENELFLSLSFMTTEEIQDYIQKKEETEDENAKEMARLFSEVTDWHKESSR